MIRKIAIAGLIIYAILYLIESFIIIYYPYQISYPEGFILNQALLIAKGEPIYKGIANYPFIVVNYPPVYLFLCASLIKLVGISFIPGRLITFIASLFIVWIIYKILREETSKEIAFISSFLFIASSYVYKNSSFMKVDILALLFCLLGIYFFIKIDEQKNTFYSIFFFIISLYTKQTFIAGPIAVVCYLFFKKKRRAFIFASLMLIPYTGIFFILNYLTKGEFFRHNILYNLNTFIFKQAVKHYILALQNHAILVFFSILFILYSFRQKKISLFIIYFIISAIVAISVGKIGANTNYFFELIALLCILTGLAIEVLKQYVGEKIYNLLIYTGITIQLLLFLHMPYLTEPTPTKRDWEDFSQLSQVIANTNGKIVSEDAGLLVLNKKNVLFQPFEFTQLANQKIWSQERFINDIKDKKFELILLSFNINCFVDWERLTPEMVGAMRESYYIEQTIGEYFLYHPVPGD